MHRDALMSLDGDVGARGILESTDVMPIEVDDAGVLADIDTFADLHRQR
jgi:molybdenum cofactor cytidylyltransferase